MTDLIQEELVAYSTSTEGVEFLKSKPSQADIKSILIAKDNGTTNFGVITAGTIMGTASGRSRPCPSTTANGAGSAVTTLVVVSTDNWYVGDAVFFEGVDSTYTIASITDATDMELSSADTWSDLDRVDNGLASDAAVGILFRAVNTLVGHDASGTALHSSRGGQIVMSGRVDESALVGDATENASDLNNITYD